MIMCVLWIYLTAVSVLRPFPPCWVVTKRYYVSSTPNAPVPRPHPKKVMFTLKALSSVFSPTIPPLGRHQTLSVLDSKCSLPHRCLILSWLSALYTRPWNLNHLSSAMAPCFPCMECVSLLSLSSVLLCFYLSKISWSNVCSCLSSYRSADIWATVHFWSLHGSEKHWNENYYNCYMLTQIERNETC